MEIIHHTNHVLTVKDFWTSQQCDEFIAKSESIGYSPALIQTPFGARRVEGVRNNQRVLFTDEELAAEIFETARPYIPHRIGNSEAIGLNELFRFYKYESGQEFRKHRDLRYNRNEWESSFYTFMIYLNDDYEGGKTSFQDLIIEPEKGMCLIFLHDLEHAGDKLVSGTKYVLRTDIMYRLNQDEGGVT